MEGYSTNDTSVDYDMTFQIELLRSHSSHVLQSFSHLGLAQGLYPYPENTGLEYTGTGLNDSGYWVPILDT